VTKKVNKIADIKKRVAFDSKLVCILEFTTNNRNIKITDETSKVLKRI
jgi:hypothetical protein